MQKRIKQKKIITDNKYHNPEVTTVNSFPLHLCLYEYYIPFYIIGIIL